MCCHTSTSVVTIEYRAFVWCIACFMLVECGEKLACARYAVFGIDYEGHGHSEGVRCYIRKFDDIVNDCSEFFKSICGRSSVFFFFGPL